MESNTTNNNLDLQNTSENSSMINIFIWFLTAITTVILCSEMAVLFILRRCKKIPYQSLQLYHSYILSDIAGAAQIIVMTVVITGFGVDTEFIYAVRIVSFGVLHSISSASITAIIFERLFVLKAKLKYQQTMKRMNISTFITLFWAFHVILAVSLITRRFYEICNFELSNCDIHNVIKTTKYACGCSMLVYGFFLFGANIIITRVARRHAEHIDALTPSSAIKISNDGVSQRQLATLKIIMYLAASNVLLKAPIITVMTVSTIDPTLRETLITRTFRSLGYMGIQVNSFVNLYLYIWKMKECRMHFFFFKSKFFKKYKVQAQKLRFEIFDIPVFEKSYSCTPPECSIKL